ncbi:hypothetical protein AX15_003770 [Amanita polypyramis BW_CC]|nr:hypothetical protein AX15_003770 [Amanita polypyramis BW_CC]
MREEDGELSLGAVFTEPNRPPTPPTTTVVYARESHPVVTTGWTRLSIRLVGSHPLWGHYLWNAARAFANYLDQNPGLYEDKCVLELGAGGGLPGIVTAMNKARRVILTDYPDADLINNLRHNIQENIPEALRHRTDVEGYIWGRQVRSLLGRLPSSSAQSRKGFDLIILSDLIFNHSQHEALLNTCEEILAPSCTNNDITNLPCVLVFYTHHRPRLAHKDMEFFQLAKQKGWSCEEVLRRKYPLMFPEDTGDEEMRSTVYGWRLTREP